MSKYTSQEKQILLSLVDETIKFGLNTNEVLQINLDNYPENLQKNTASFVTLEIEGELRGCIGTLKAYQPLVKDVIKNAYAAAFKDNRFKPLTLTEYPKLKKSISILSASVQISFSSEKDLLKKIQPKIDGIILSDEGHQATFLPAVWHDLQEPKIFLQQLKIKAGLPKDYWSNNLKIERYSVETIE